MVGVPLPGAVLMSSSCLSIGAQGAYLAHGHRGTWGTGAQGHGAEWGLLCSGRPLCLVGLGGWLQRCLSSDACCSPMRTTSAWRPPPPGHEQGKGAQRQVFFCYLLFPPPPFLRGCTLQEETNESARGMGMRGGSQSVGRMSSACSPPNPHSRAHTCR